MDAERRTRLEAEARHLYRRLFGGEATAEVAQRYVEAHERFSFVETEPELALVRAVVQRGLNVEAVEYVLRLRHKDNVLSRKVAVLHYLAECRPELFGLFLNTRPGLARGACSLLLALARVPLLYLVGRFQARRHGLA